MQQLFNHGQPPLPPYPGPQAGYARNTIYNPSIVPPCRFFLSSKGCMKGSACEYKHEGQRLHPQPVASHKTASPGQPKEKKLCRFFAKGECRNGTSCSFSHELDSAQNLPDMSSLRISKARQANRESDANLLAALEADKILTRDLLGPFFSVDVECVATGTGYADRDVARIAVVDENETTIFDSYVKPEKPIVSYLTQLTGITAEMLETAQALPTVIEELKKVLPLDSVLVGQSVDKDVHWLGLKAGLDFREIFNVADLFRVPTSASYQYRYFSLRHVAKYLLEASIQEHDHDPVVDAVFAMKIFKRFRYLHESSGHRQAVLQTLLKTPRTPSFAEWHPVIDGVRMSPPKEDNLAEKAAAAPSNS